MKTNHCEKCKNYNKKGMFTSDVCKEYKNHKEYITIRHNQMKGERCHFFKGV
jgi:hypothetical protein